MLNQNANKIEQINEIHQQSSNQSQGLQIKTQTIKSGMIKNEENVRAESQEDVKEVLDYQQLASISKLHISEECALSQNLIYQKYTKLLNKRAMYRLERKAVIAGWRNDQAEKERLQHELIRIQKQKQQAKEKVMDTQIREFKHIQGEIELQQQLIKSLKRQVSTLDTLLQLSQTSLNHFPRTSMNSICEMMNEQSKAIQSTGAKVMAELQLQDVLLSNLQQIVNEFP